MQRIPLDHWFSQVNNNPKKEIHRKIRNFYDLRFRIRSRRPSISCKRIIFPIFIFIFFGFFGSQWVLGRRDLAQFGFDWGNWVRVSIRAPFSARRWVSSEFCGGGTRIRVFFFFFGWVGFHLFLVLIFYGVIRRACMYVFWLGSTCCLICSCAVAGVRTG